MCTGLSCDLPSLMTAVLVGCSAAVLGWQEQQSVILQQLMQASLRHKTLAQDIIAGMGLSRMAVSVWRNQGCCAILVGRRLIQ